MSPLVSVIIPTLNEENSLPKLLNCLQKQTFKNFEVIISDAGSKDKTREIAENSGAKIVEGGLPGIGRNNGAKIAKGSILVFIDSDVSFENDFLEESIQDFVKKKLDLAIPYFNLNAKKLQHNIFFLWNNLYKRLMKRTRFPDGTGQLNIILKSTFEELGGYPDYIMGEDTELFWKAARKRFKVGTVKKKFNSSTRRLESVGIFWVLAAFTFIGPFMMLGIAGDKRVQKIATKIYGGFGKAKKS